MEIFKNWTNIFCVGTSLNAQNRYILFYTSSCSGFPIPLENQVTNFYSSTDAFFELGDAVHFVQWKVFLWLIGLALFRRPVFGKIMLPHKGRHWLLRPTMRWRQKKYIFAVNALRKRYVRLGGEWVQAASDTFTIGLKIPFTPKGSRFCEVNLLRYLNSCYVNHHLPQIKDLLSIIGCTWAKLKLLEIVSQNMPP